MGRGATPGLRVRPEEPTWLLRFRAADGHHHRHAAGRTSLRRGFPTTRCAVRKLGWRLPFVASLALVFVGLWIRKGLDETPSIQAAKDSGDVAKVPLVETLKYHWREVLVAIGAKVGETGPFYIFATFVVSYATGTLTYERSDVLNAVSLGAAVSTMMILVMGHVSDTWGRLLVYRAGIVLTAFYAAPFFQLLDLQTPWAVFAAVVVGLGLIWPPVTSTLGTLTSEIFSTRVRFTGVTLGYQIGAALAGGTAPLLATWMLRLSGGSWWPIAALIIFYAALSFIAVLAAPCMARNEPDREEAMEATAQRELGDGAPSAGTSAPG